MGKIVFNHPRIPFEEFSGDEEYNRTPDASGLPEKRVAQE